MVGGLSQWLKMGRSMGTVDGTWKRSPDRKYERQAGGNQEQETGIKDRGSREILKTAAERGGRRDVVNACGKNGRTSRRPQSVPRNLNGAAFFNDDFCSALLDPRRFPGSVVAGAKLSRKRSEQKYFSPSDRCAVEKETRGSNQVERRKKK